jgi:hypothetical protein
LWEGRKTALLFSGLSINRHFHGLPRSPRNSQAATFTVASIQSFSNCIGLAVNMFLSWSGEATHLMKKLPPPEAFSFLQTLISIRSHEGVFS